MPTHMIGPLTTILSGVRENAPQCGRLRPKLSVASCPGDALIVASIRVVLLLAALQESLCFQQPVVHEQSE